MIHHDTNRPRTGTAPNTASLRKLRRGKNIKRGAIALGGTAMLVLCSGGGAFASTGPLDLSGLLGGTGVDGGAQANVNAGTGTGPTLPSVPSLPSVPAVPSLPAPVSSLPTTGTLIGTAGNALGGATGTLDGLLTGLGLDLNLNEQGTATGPAGSAGTGGSSGPSTGGSVSSGGASSLGVGDPLSLLVGAPAGASADANVGGAHGDASANVDPAGSSQNVTGPATTDHATISAAEASGPDAHSSGLSWELALIGFGAVGTVGAANVYVIRRTREI